MANLPAVAPGSASGLVHETLGEDLERLRAFGLGDPEIFDVVLTAAARSSFSRSLDSIGEETDEACARKLGVGVATELAVGRPFPLTMRPME